jgi:hypothetical protein
VPHPVSADAALALTAAVRDGSPAGAREARRALRLLGPSAVGAADGLFALAVAADGAPRAELVATSRRSPERADVTVLLVESVAPTTRRRRRDPRAPPRGAAGVAALKGLAADPAGCAVMRASSSDD